MLKYEKAWAVSPHFLHFSCSRALSGNWEARILFSGITIPDKKVHISGWALKENYCTYKKVFNPVAFYIVLGH